MLPAEHPAATPSLLREFAEALDKDRGHDKSMVTRTMRDAADEIARLYEELRISYPATPVDCLLSDLESTWEGLPPPWFVRRVSDFRDEMEAESRG